MTPLSNCNNLLSAIEQCPPEIIGNVLSQLNKTTGSEGFVNEADIPVIMRYVSNLAITSKKMCELINSPSVTHLFLNSLSDKYQETPEHFAALFNTIGARKWLWNYIREKGDYETYQVIHDIYTVASTILKDAKDTGQSVNCSEKWSSPDSFYKQTKQGFFLYNYKSDFLNYNIYSPPFRVATPFGQIQFFSEGTLPHLISSAFIKKLNATFEKDSDQYSMYKIRQIGEKILPDARFLETSEKERSRMLIGSIWEMLEKNHKGQDPVQKEIEQKNGHIISNSVEKPLFKNLSEVTSWAINLIKTLEAQPLFSINDPLFSTKDYDDISTRVLALNYYEAHRLKSLNGAIQTALEKKKQRGITAFNTNDPINDPTLYEKNPGQGLLLYFSSSNYEPLDLDKLRMHYDYVFENLGLHWTISNLKDYPNLYGSKSEEDYVLFIKKECFFPEELSILKQCSALLGISRFMDCGNTREHSSTDDIQTLYLWVRKDKKEEVLKVLNLKSEAK